MIWVPIAALALYLLGTAVHECSHILACYATGSRVQGITAHPTAVYYDPPSDRADKAVKLAPVALSLPLLTGYFAFLFRDPFSIRLLGIAFVIGYIPRSQTDWGPLATIFK